ncbi:protein of unknown function [Pararobbsia alpina]
MPPLRLGDAGGKAFASQAEAMMAGCTAARRIIDDLFATAVHASIAQGPEV